MYEAAFSLQRRPFAATPDAGCWFHDGPFQAVLDELLVCAERGQGVGVLIAAAGAGKTLVCERLVRELQQGFATVFLRHATFTTRRSLLQSILCELEQPFDHATDQELRLAIARTLKELHAAERALAIVVDEAHQLSEAVLEELRILSDHAQDGRPLVRLILAGQLDLEEKLALPSAQALNQRIRAHVALPTLTQAESADYVDYRVTWAGGRTTETFTPEALDVICRAADGVPRCLNQLCDHALLSAFAAGERPVSARTVLDALADLTRLPLAWNPIALRETPPADALCDKRPGLSEGLASRSQTSLEEEPACEALRAKSFLTDKPLRHREAGSSESPGLAQSTSDVVGVLPESFEEPVVAPDGFQEEVVSDRYTALDAGVDLPADAATAQQLAREPLPVAEVLSHWSNLWSQPAAAERLAQRLAAIQHVLDAVATAEAVAFDNAPLPGSDASELGQVGNETIEEQLKDAVLELREETQQHLAPRDDRPPREEPQQWTPTQSEAADSVLEFGADFEPSSVTTSAEPPATPEPRSCRNLFTRLRRKQQGRE
jgi:type II secretory pathway predicted ATPase ExeA